MNMTGVCKRIRGTPGWLRGLLSAARPMMSCALGLVICIASGHAAGAAVNPQIRNVTTVLGTFVLDHSYQNAYSPFNGSDHYGGEDVQSDLSAFVSEFGPGNLNLFGAASASVTGIDAAAAQSIVGGGYTFTLPAPATTKIQGGKLVLRFELLTDIINDALVSLIVTTNTEIAGSFVVKTSVTNVAVPGISVLTFIDVVYDLPANIDPAKAIQGAVGLSLTSLAEIAPTAASGSAHSSAHGAVFADSFRVLDSAGNQLPGLGPMATSAGAPISEYVPPTPPPDLQEIAYEFYNPAQDHYFMSSIPAEIGDLDSGVHRGWVRTGLSFNVIAAPVTAAAAKVVAATANPVCRFYIPPQHGDSHFFSADPAECARVLQFTATNPNYSGFVYETPDAYQIYLPDPVSGSCPSGTFSVYRLWNNRADSNHRYTTDASVKALMVAKGYVAEGYGPNAVIMCAPK